MTHPRKLGHPQADARPSTAPARVLELLDQSAFRPSTSTAIRTSFRRASASASPLPGPWRLNPAHHLRRSRVGARRFDPHKVIALLESLRHRLGISFLFIVPRSGRGADFADTVYRHESGEIVERGPTPQIFRGAAAPLHPNPAGRQSRSRSRCSGSEAISPAHG